jgi:hypothetical protein
MVQVTVCELTAQPVEALLIVKLELRVSETVAVDTVAVPLFVTVRVRMPGPA